MDTRGDQGQREASQEQPSQGLVSLTEMHTLTFYGKPILVVRLRDGRPAVVLRSLCENLAIDTNAQVRRVRRTEAIAQDLAQALILTEGGQQTAYVLLLRSVPYWLATLDPNRARPEVRADIIRYQRECVDVLYAWAQQLPRATSEAHSPDEEPAHHVPAPISEGGSGTALLLPAPQEPGPEATPAERATYHEFMSVWHRRQADLHAQAWRTEIHARIEEHEARLEAKEALLHLIPEMLERLGPETISPQQQGLVRGYVKRLHEVSGKPYPTIYDDLRRAFGPARYQDLLASEWPQVEQWFRIQIERASQRKES